MQSIGVLSLSFLDVGFAEIYQMIQNLNNRKTAKAGFKNHIIDCLIIIAHDHWWSSGNSQQD